MRAVQPMPPQFHTNAIRPAFLNKDRSVQAFTRRATPPICFAFNKEQPCRFPTARSSINAPHAAAITLRPGAIGGRNCQIHSGHLSPPSKAGRVTTPVSPTVLSQLLVGCDPASTNYLVKGFQSGFAIGCLNVPNQSEVPNNLPSATQYPGIIVENCKRPCSRTDHRPTVFTCCN